MPCSLLPKTPHTLTEMDLVKPFIEKEEAAPCCLAAAAAASTAAGPESAAPSPAELTGLVGWACSAGQVGVGLSAWLVGQTHFYAAGESPDARSQSLSLTGAWRGA